MPSFFKFLRRHPFPVDARFDRVVALSFAFPKSILRPLVPGFLEIDSFEDFGFVTVAMVWTKSLRPATFPAFLGQDFFLAGYRIFTRLRDDSGRRLRGLQILRSETDKHRMVWIGNFFTSYHYRHVKVNFLKTDRETRVETFLANGRSTLDITFASSNKPVPLPTGSPFPNWQAARRFAGPMPFTFSAESDGVFLVIEGSRQDWVPRPVVVKQWRVSLFEETPLCGAEPILANAFEVENVSYRWKKGRIVRPKIPL